MSIRYDELLPQTKAAYQALVTWLANQGVTVTLADFGGFRTLGDTTLIEEYRQDDYNVAVQAGAISADTTLQQFRPIAPYGSSYHDYGAAFDLAVTGRPAGMSTGQVLALAGAHAPTLGLRWPLPSTDPAHFQLAGSLADVQAKWAAYQDQSAGNNDVGSGGDIAGADSGTGSTVAAVLAALAVVGGIAFILRRQWHALTAR